MFDATASHAADAAATPWDDGHAAGNPLLALLRGCTPKRRLLKPKAVLFRAGEAAGSLFVVHSGVFRTSIASDDGREKTTGFRLRGDVLGLESLGLAAHASDACALATGEVWEYTREQLAAAGPAVQAALALQLAATVRRDWDWMLATGTLSAEQRVVAFLLDLGERMQALGFSARAMTLHMTRTDIGSFLSLQLETVVRALSKLQALGLVALDGRELVLREPAALRALLARPAMPTLRAA